MNKVPTDGRPVMPEALRTLVRQLGERAVQSESAVTLLLDGDAGLGYFPCWRAAHALVEKAKEHGVGVAVTRHHGHFGAAGLYTRVAAAAGLIGYDTSGHQLKLEPGKPLLAAAGG